MSDKEYQAKYRRIKKELGLCARCNKKAVIDPNTGKPMSLCQEHREYQLRNQKKNRNKDPLRDQKNRASYLRNRDKRLSKQRVDRYLHAIYAGIEKLKEQERTAMSLKPLKYILFDVFGTLVNADMTLLTDRLAYAQHISQEHWSPLVLPEEWHTLLAHVDSRRGLAMLRKFGYRVVAMTNFPVYVTMDIANFNELSFDFVMPLELFHTFKPNHKAYLSAMSLLKAEPSECMMVTANEDFGDLQAADALGMQSAWINRKQEKPGGFLSVPDLANELFSTDEDTFHRSGIV